MRQKSKVAKRTKFTSRIAMQERGGILVDICTINPMSAFFMTNHSVKSMMGGWGWGLLSFIAD